MNPGGKFYDPFGCLLDFIADFLGWCEGGISQPIMTNHPVFIRIGDGSFFQRCHVGQMLFCTCGSILAKNSSDTFIRLKSTARPTSGNSV